MAKLTYSAITSLDGYVADEAGNWDWSEPDEEVHTFVNDRERSVGTLLLGRRMYEVLVAWEKPENIGDERVIQEYARIWKAAEKVVYSKTLAETSSAKTRIEPEFEPGAVEEMKAAAEQDISIGGPTLAAQALEAGLVDECQLYLSPVVVGGGKQALPDGLRLELELLDQRRFGNGVVYLRYGTRT